MHWVYDFKRWQVAENDLLVNFDVVSLYTKIPVEDAIKFIEELTDKETSTLVRVFLRSTFFTFRGSFYEQTKGVAMGSLLKLLR
jgi:hypothetical protein